MYSFMILCEAFVSTQLLFFFFLYVAMNLNQTKIPRSDRRDLCLVAGMMLPS